MFYHLYWCLASAISIVHGDLLILNIVIRITLKVSSIRIHLPIGSLNGTNRLSEVTPYLLSNFPFVNLQIKSIVESLRPIKSCTQ